MPSTPWTSRRGPPSTSGRAVATSAWSGVPRPIFCASARRSTMRALLSSGSALAGRAVDQRVEVGQPAQRLAGDRDGQRRGRPAAAPRAASSVWPRAALHRASAAPRAQASRLASSILHAPRMTRGQRRRRRSSRVGTSRRLRGAARPDALRRLGEEGIASISSLRLERVSSARAPVDCSAAIDRRRRSACRCPSRARAGRAPAR